jgi:DNA-binding transcriptional MocR family regulator
MGAVIRGTQLCRLLGAWHGGMGGGMGGGMTNSAGRRRTPEYRALADAVRGLLTDGRLALGVRMPAEREFAESLAVSRTTVSAAYRSLRETGHVTSRRGAGSWTTLPGGHRVQLDGLTAPAFGPGLLDLACAALPAPAELCDALAEASAELPRHAAGAGYEPMGLPVLREMIAQGYAARGLPTDPSQILVTNGVQHAFDLLLRLLVEPGHRAIVETPTYPNALRALAAARARVITYGLGPAGWDADVLFETLRSAGARIAYLVPDYHNPTGHLMGDQVRERLASTARSARVDLIIDESFADLRLSGPPMPAPVAAFDSAARVISVGSMSKLYWGGLRIGWIRAPAPVVARLAELRLAVDVASPVLDQLVAARLLPRREAIVAARGAQLRDRRAALVAALAEHAPEWRFQTPDGGLSLWVELDAPVATALARGAERMDVRIAAGPRFGVDGTLERFVRLPYTLPEGDLVDAVRRLASVRRTLELGDRRDWARLSVVA